MKNKQSNGIYVNKEISSIDEDLLGISTQVDAIDDAINDGASMIGVVGDFGSGKSSVSEMLSQKDKSIKIIKINMWDSLRSKDRDVSEDTLISLDKTFLYQLAFNSGKKNLARHVNKRLNKSNGFISFTLKSLSFWIYFAFSMLFVALGILVFSSNFSFKICGYTVYSEIYWLSYLIAAIIFLLGLRKSSIAFSSWKSEGDKNFDSSDAFSIFSEIVDCTKNTFKNRKNVVIIEDLDRLGSNDYNLIVAFIKEVYRFSNLSKPYYSFIVAIKPAAVLDKNGGDQLDYDKIFDYIVELKPIHIDDFNSILKNLLQSKQEFLKALTGKEEDALVSEFSRLISGENLSIRKLKHRLNASILLFQSLKNKNSENSKNISMKTCCIVVYLQNQYPKDYQLLVTSEALFNQIVRQAYAIRLDQSASVENKISSLWNFMLQQQTKKSSGQPIFSRDFCYELATFFINGLITNDFRQYFYSYPKDSYIKTVEESELYNLILFSQTLEDSHLDELVSATFTRSGKVIDDAINMLKSSNLTIPTFILTNEALLSYCYQKFPDEIIKTMVENLLWNTENMDRTISIISKINSYSSVDKEGLFVKYANAILPHVISLGKSALDCRLKLTKVLGDQIQFFAPVFLSASSLLLTADEIEAMPNEMIVFAVLNEKRVDSNMLNAINKKFKTKLQPRHCEQLLKAMNAISTNTRITKELATDIISILKSNSIVDESLLEYVIKCPEITDDIVEYINALGDDNPNTYYDIIDKNKIIGKFSHTIIEKFYEHKYYVSFLANSLYAENATDKCFIEPVATENTVDLLYRISPKMFVEYRQQILLQKTDIRSKLRFAFNGQYPFVSEEREFITSFDCVKLFDEATILNNFNAYIEICNKAINDSEDLYQVSMFVLSLSSNRRVEIFNKFDFNNDKYANIKKDKQNEILDAYENIEALQNIQSIVAYMRLTKTLNEELECRLLSDVRDGHLNKENLIEYYNLLNELNDCTQATLDIINETNYVGELPVAVTDKLFVNGHFINYIVGTTLRERAFEYNYKIDLKYYKQVYVTLPNVAKYMMQNQQLLNEIYFSKDYSLLSKEQVFRFNDWNQFHELFKTAMELSTSDIDRKNYIMAINRFATLEDSNAIADYICQEKFVTILLDDEVKNRLTTLLWNDNPGKKIKLTKFVNRHRNVA